MKRFVCGVVFGVILALSVSAMAANTSLVGKAITNTFPIEIDGELSNLKAYNADGTTVLPIRQAGELFGYEVGFENGTVILTKKTLEYEQPLQQGERTDIPQEEGEKVSQEKTKEDIERDIKFIESDIGVLKFNINYNNGMAEKLEEKGNLTDEEKQQLKNYKTEAQKLQEQLRQLERQKAELEAQLKQLEAAE